ncbi:hypothetical protein tb265_36220 [Gemmatimonadetes bacterium T265]|nr:hypothetical protein tb265_36220 [Gemmatimonadetes bacterium T265]
MDLVTDPRRESALGIDRGRRPVRATVGLLVGAAGVAVAYAMSAFMGAAVVLCVLVGVLIITPLALRLWTDTFDLFEPVTIISIVYFVYFVVGPLARIATDDLSFIGRSSEADFVPVLVAIAVAVSAMWLGYALPIGPRPALRDTPLSSETVDSVRYGRRMAGLLVVMAGLGIIVWARLAGRSLRYFLLPGVSQAADAGQGGTDIPYFFFAVEWFIPAVAVLIATDGLRGRFARTALIAFVTVMYVSIGFRYRIAVLWFAAGIVAYLRVGRRPRVLHLVVPCSLAFLGAGWLAAAREFFRSGGAAGSLGFDLRSALLAGLSDTRIFETFGAVLATVPRFLPYAGITPFAYPFLLWIPRFVWPGKPVPFWLGYVGQSIGTPETFGAGAAVPQFGEFYIAFGWPGIMIGMFIFGAAAKWLWRWYRASPDDPWRQAIFALNASLLFLAIIRGYFAQIAQEWCFVVLPAVVIAALARRRARRAAGRAVGRSAEVVADA